MDHELTSHALGGLARSNTISPVKSVERSINQYHTLTTTGGI